MTPQPNLHFLEDDKLLSDIDESLMVNLIFPQQTMFSALRGTPNISLFTLCPALLELNLERMIGYFRHLQFVRPSRALLGSSTKRWTGGFFCSRGSLQPTLFSSGAPWRNTCGKVRVPEGRDVQV